MRNSSRIIGLVIAIFYFGLASPGFAQLLSFKNKVANGYNFWLDIPDEYNDHDTVFPVIVFLHGRSLSGSNLESVKRYGVLNEVIKRRQVPALVIAPQCPSSQQWDPDRVLNLLDFVKDNYRIDTNRIYITGMSLGGYGVLHFAGKYPEKVAAAVALCGGGNIDDSISLAQVPLWIMHGKQDRSVPYSESEKIVRSIRNVNEGKGLKFDFYKTLGHHELARFFMMDELYEWLFRYSLSDSPRVINDSIYVGEKRFRSRSVRAMNTILADDKPYEQLEDDFPGKVYSIKKGDTLTHIARRYGVTVNELCSANNISRNSILRIGTEIVIP